jgi:hypothetical protein
VRAIGNRRPGTLAEDDDCDAGGDKVGLQMNLDRDQWLEVCKPRVGFERRTREERSYHLEAATSFDTCHDLVEDPLYSGRCRREYGEEASSDGTATAHGR